MITVKEIRDLKEYYVKDLHTNRVANQRSAQTFYDDSFEVDIKTPMKVSRTGTGAWLVDGPASHIITRNPQAFLKPKRQNEVCRTSQEKVNALYNHWLREIIRQTPQPLKEFVKNLLLRGEGWINPSWREDWTNESAFIPITFFVPDPLNIYGSPVEDRGIPESLIVWQKVSALMIRRLYPKWQSEKNYKPKQSIAWMAYYDAESRYFEADGKDVEGEEIQPNILGIVPFIHAYSGFGKDSPDGDPMSQTIGRLDKVQDLLIQECEINSDINSTLRKFSQPKVDFETDLNTDIDTEQIKNNYDMSAGAANVLPPGIRIKEGVRVQPSQETFQHFANIRGRISLEAPPIMAGLPGGTSGRQEDIVGTHFIRRFDSVVEAAEIAWAKALDMGKQILTVYPKFLPLTEWLEKPEGGEQELTIDKDDLDNVSPCEVKLKAIDPIEDDRKLMAGRALWKEGAISHKTLLIDHVGYTPDKADEEITQTIAEKIVTQSPLLMELIGKHAFEKLGMKDELEALQAQQALQNKMGAAIKEQSAMTGPKGGPPRSFNEQRSPDAFNQVDMMLSQGGARQPPTGGA